MTSFEHSATYDENETRKLEQRLGHHSSKIPRVALDCNVNNNLLDDDPFFFYINDADELNYLKMLGVNVSPEKIEEILIEFRAQVLALDTINTLERQQNYLSAEESFSALLYKEAQRPPLKTNSYKHLFKKILIFWRKHQYAMNTDISLVDSSVTSCSSSIFPQRVQTIQHEGSFFSLTNSLISPNKRKKTWFIQGHLKKLFKLQ